MAYGMIGSLFRAGEQHRSICVGSNSTFMLISIASGGGGGRNQAYSRFSTTHGHITDCKLDSVVYACVCEVIS